MSESTPSPSIPTWKTTLSLAAAGLLDGQAGEQGGERAGRAPRGALRRYGDRRADPARHRAPHAVHPHRARRPAPRPLPLAGLRRAPRPGPPRLRAGFLRRVVSSSGLPQVRPEGGDAVSATERRRVRSLVAQALHLLDPPPREQRLRRTVATESRFRGRVNDRIRIVIACFSTSLSKMSAPATWTSALTLVSPDEDLLAYSVDTDGDEVFELRFRDLRTGADLPDTDRPELLRRRVERRLAVVLLHRARRGLPALAGAPAPARHRPRRRRGRARGARPAVRARPPGHPERRPDRRSGARAARPARRGWSTRRRPSRRRARSAGRRHGVRLPGRARAHRPPGDRMLVVTNDGAVEFRLMTAPGARATPTRTPRRGSRRGPSTPTSGSGRRTRSPTGSCSPTGPAAQHRLRIVGARRPGRRRARAQQPLRRRLSRPRPQPDCTTRRR